MATKSGRGRQRKIVYVSDIPAIEIQNLSEILDVLGKNNWEKLAALMEYPKHKIEAFKMAYRRNSGSPCTDLLRVYGQGDSTVTDLFLLLKQMNHVRCMDILKPYVDPVHHVKQPVEDSLASYTTSAHSNASVNKCRCSETVSFNTPFVNLLGINIEDLPIPEPPQLDLTCSICSQSSSLSSSSSSSFDRTQEMHQSHYPSTYESNKAQNTKSVKSAPLPTADLINLNIGDKRHASSFQTVSTTSCNLSEGERQQVYDSNSLCELGDLEILQSWDASDKPLTLEEQRQRDRMTALATMNHKKYKEISHSTNDFDESMILGEGAFGRVYRAVLNETPFAVKRLMQNEHTGFSQERSARKYQINEIVALLKYRHTNIVPLCFYSLDGPEPCLVYEFMHNGSLQDNLIGKRHRFSLKWKLRMNIAKGSARGIQFLHTAIDKPLIHGDIKSGNILLDKHNEPKIGDFGLAREGPNANQTSTYLKTETVHGTVAYLPPEFLKNFRLSTKVDTYSFGVVMFEIVSGHMAFDDRPEWGNKKLMDYTMEEVLDEQRTPEKIVTMLRDARCSDWPISIAMEFIEIAIKCTKHAPKHRPEVKQVLQELEKLELKVQNIRQNKAVVKCAVQNTEPYELVDERLQVVSVEPEKEGNVQLSKEPEELDDDDENRKGEGKVNKNMDSQNEIESNEENMQLTSDERALNKLREIENFDKLTIKEKTDETEDESRESLEEISARKHRELEDEMVAFENRKQQNDNVISNEIEPQYMSLDHDHHHQHQQNQFQDQQISSCQTGEPHVCQPPYQLDHGNQHHYVAPPPVESSAHSIGPIMGDSVHTPNRFHPMSGSYERRNPPPVRYDHPHGYNNVNYTGHPISMPYSYADYRHAPLNTTRQESYPFNYPDSIPYRQYQYDGPYLRHPQSHPSMFINSVPPPNPNLHSASNHYPVRDPDDIEPRRDFMYYPQKKQHPSQNGSQLQFYSLESYPPAQPMHHNVYPPPMMEACEFPPNNGNPSLSPPPDGSDRYHDERIAWQQQQAWHAQHGRSPQQQYMQQDLYRDDGPSQYREMSLRWAAGPPPSQPYAARDYQSQRSTGSSGEESDVSRAVQHQQQQK